MPPTKRILWLLAVVALASRVPAAAAAESDDPAAPQALGRVFAAGPTPPSLFVLASGGYGYTQDLLGRGDAHHRTAGALAFEGRPLSWLGLALRFDGRYDLHVIPGQPRDDGLVGDPRFYARADFAISRSLRAAARLGVWLPGSTAPSIDLSATTPELGGALTWEAGEVPLWITTNLGYRLDRSARSVMDPARLSDADRVSLEVSAYDQVLAGVGAAYGRGRVQGFVEAGADVLVGSGHPGLSASPMRAGAGARIALGERLRMEAAAEASRGTPPAIGPTAPLMPIPPRVGVWLGLAYRFGDRTAPAPVPPPIVVAPPPPTPPPPPPPASADLAGRVQVEGGGTPVNPRVSIESGAESRTTTAAAAVEDDGRFTFTGKPGQVLTVKAEADGCEPATVTVTLSEDQATEVTLTLPRRLPSGQIRGLVRSLAGRALEAEIRIDPPGRSLRTVDGRFEIDVAPGSYEVTIIAPRFVEQKRTVQVEQNGVTLLNVDLRAER